MKGKVFIGWSGTNSLAHRVKARLEQHDYEGVVGGQGEKSEGRYVGEVIIKELNKCDQAIFIMEKKQDFISNNTMFELGYALADLPYNKIHLSYIDIPENDGIIPSDLRGLWAHHYERADYTNPDEIVEKIVQRFIQNQKNIISDNKMKTVADYFNIKQRIQLFCEKPACSEYEFAQYLLFFALGAYMFDSEQEALRALNYLSNLPTPIKELTTATRFAKHYLSLFEKIRKQGSTLYLEQSDFRDMRKKFKSIRETVETWEENDFTLWFRAMLYDITNYAYTLYACNPELDEETKVKHFNTSIDLARQCLTVCEKLNQSPKNQECVWLMRSYMYRNLCTAHKNLGDVETAYEYLDRSRQERQALLNQYEISSINSKLYANFELEYYLALSEYMEYRPDEEEIEYCEEYVSRVKNQHQAQNFFVDKIAAFVKNAKR